MQLSHNAPVSQDIEDNIQWKMLLQCCSAFQKRLFSLISPVFFQVVPFWYWQGIALLKKNNFVQ